VSILVGTGKLTVRYCARLSEVSYVDRPAVPVATFQYIKANGETEMRKFATSARPTPPAGWEWWEPDVWDDRGAILVPTGEFDDSTGFEGFGPGEGVALATVPPAAETYTLPREYSDDDTGFE
jgi:hypothetical protein